MKLKSLLPVCAVLTLLAFSSCKKETTTDPVTDTPELQATFALSANMGVADNLTQDVNDVLNEAAIDKNFMGSGFTAQPSQTAGILSCASVTVTPISGFPKNIVIDFGPGCTSPSGVTRSGKILVHLTDSLRNPGSVAAMTFQNYFVNNFKKEGNLTWTNTSTPGVKSWRRVMQNGKITAPNGNFWTHFGTQDIVQTAGVFTPLYLLDDEFSVTGGHTVANPAGITRTRTILTALQKKTNCPNIDKGSYRVQGPSHFAIIDFGNGVCDNLATISIDGNPPQTFTLN